MEPRNRKARNVILLRALGLMVAVFVVVLLFMFWGTRIPKRPADISSRGIFLEAGLVPFKLSMHGDWLECWKDERTTLNRCRYTDEQRAVYFEDFVLPYEGISPVPDKELVIDAGRTRGFHYGVTDKNLRFPLIFLRNGQILLPQSDYDWGKQNVDYWVSRKRDKVPTR